MGTKTPRPDTIDPDLLWMIDRYVDNALVETGTSELAHGRLARASIPPPLVDFMAPPSVDHAAADHASADLVRELAPTIDTARAEAMAAAEIAALSRTAYIRSTMPSPSAPVRVLLRPPPREFVDESPTDLDDDEPTGLFEPPRR